MDDLQKYISFVSSIATEAIMRIRVLPHGENAEEDQWQRLQDPLDRLIDLRLILHDRRSSFFSF